MPSPDSAPVNRRRLTAFILGSLIAAAAVAGAIFSLVPPEYEAHSLIRVSPPPAGPFSTSGPVGDPDLGRVIETEMVTLTSDRVLDEALGQPEVSKHFEGWASPRDHLRTALRVVNLKNTPFLRVSYASPSPDEAATIVDAVVASYMAAQSEQASRWQKMLVRRLEDYDQLLHRELVEQGGELERVTSRASRPDVVPPEDVSPISFTSLTEDLARSTAERLVQVDLDLARERDPEKAADLKKTQSGLRALLALPVAGRNDPTADLSKARIDQGSRRLEEVRRKVEDAKFASDLGNPRVVVVDTARKPAVPSRDLRGPLMAAATVSILMVGLALGLQPGRARATEPSDEA